MISLKQHHHYTKIAYTLQGCLPYFANQNISEDGVFKLNGPPNYEEPVDYENEVTSRVVDVGELALNHKGVRVSDRDVLLVKK